MTDDELEVAAKKLSNRIHDPHNYYEKGRKDERGDLRALLEEREKNAEEHEEKYRKTYMANIGKDSGNWQAHNSRKWWEGKKDEDRELLASLGEKELKGK